MNIKKTLLIKQQVRLQVFITAIIMNISLDFDNGTPNNFYEGRIGASSCCSGVVRMV